MPWLDFFWTPRAERKIMEHGLTRDYVEAVIQNPQAKAVSRSTGIPLASGYTQDGRWIVCFYEKIAEITVMPITAYEPMKRS